MHYGIVVALVVPQHLIILKYSFYILSLLAWVYFFSSIIEKEEKELTMGKSLMLIIILVVTAVANFIGLILIMGTFEKHIGRHDWLFEYINVIIMLMPSFQHLWRLIHACKSKETALMMCFVNILIIQALLYAGLGIATYPGNGIDSALTGNFIDWIFLVLSIGVSRVIQFAGIYGSEFPTTQLTLAFFIGSIVNVITTGFAISYISSWIIALQDSKTNSLNFTDRFRKMNYNRNKICKKQFTRGNR
jgi:hypothetical protein